MPASNSESASVRRKPKLNIPGFNTSKYKHSNTEPSASLPKPCEQTETPSCDPGGGVLIVGDVNVHHSSQDTKTSSQTGDVKNGPLTPDILTQNKVLKEGSSVSSEKRSIRPDRAQRPLSRLRSEELNWDWSSLAQPSVGALNKTQNDPRQERLRDLQAIRMRTILDRVRRKGDPVVSETTSLGDLELARRPFEPDPQEEDVETAKLPTSSNISHEIAQTEVKEPVIDDNEPGKVEGSEDRTNDTKSTQSAIKKEGDEDQRSAEYEVNSDPGALTMNENSPSSIPNSGIAFVEKSWSSGVRTEDNAWQSDLDRNASSHMAEDIKPEVKQEFRMDECLTNWDGGMVPARTDWQDRPMFSNHSDAFNNQIDAWTTECLTQFLTTQDLQPDLAEQTLPRIQAGLLSDTTQIPDGIGLVSRDFSINSENAGQYGYELEPTDITKYARSTPPEYFESISQVDPNDPQNKAILHGETTEQLVQNWNRHKRIQSVQTMPTSPRSLRRAVLSKYIPAANLNAPLLNIYLRPAVNADVPQMTSIYNWHVENGPRTAENQPIFHRDMQFRLDEAQSGKFPFLVAVEKSRASGADKRRNTHSATSQAGSTVQQKLREEEKIVGWACAQDFTASDFAERISAELEVYVEFKSRKKGVGRCLMDKLLEACDRGYNPKGGYPFHCAPEVAYLYSGGGGRDLHKLLFLVRKWRFPTKFRGRVDTSSQKKNGKQRERVDDLDDDFDVWLESWLESWEFEKEAYLTGVGAKRNRFLDLVYMTKETKWQPAEGELYDPIPGLAGTRRWN